MKWTERFLIDVLGIDYKNLRCRDIIFMCDTGQTAKAAANEAKPQLASEALYNAAERAEALQRYILLHSGLQPKCATSMSPEPGLHRYDFTRVLGAGQLIRTSAPKMADSDL